MVKIGCNDCAGCSKCCENMQGLITLDPYDIYRMCKGIKNSSFETLLEKHIEFTVDRGILIPTLAMDKNTGKCTFLNEEGRCSIHDYRSGVCRLFPMGRVYEDGSFYYFLQKDECDYKVKTKVKLKNWLDISDLAKYEQYISDWHYFIATVREYITDEDVNQINQALIQMFFVKPYTDNFYDDFYVRLEKVKALFLDVNP